LSLSKKKAGPSDEACEYENSKFVGTIGLTNGLPSWTGVISRNVMDYLAKREEPTFTKEVFPINESDDTRLSKFRCKRILYQFVKR